MMDTQDLDAVLTEWGRQSRAAAGPQPMPELIRRTRRPRHFGWQLAAGAVAVAVAAALAVELPGLLAKNGPADPLRGITSTASAAPGFQVVTYHGLSITVPASWRVGVGMACPAPNHGIVVLPGTSALCLPNRIAIVEFGGLQPIPPERVTSTQQVTIDGVPAVRQEGDYGRPAVAYVVARLQAAVLFYPTASETADDLAASLRVDAVDVHGCASRIRDPKQFPGLTSAASGAAGALIPGQPESLLACRYEDGWLEQGGTLSGTKLQAFVTTVNGLPAGLSRAANTIPYVCPGDPSIAHGVPLPGDDDLYRLELRYPDRSPVLLTARVGWCGDLGIGDGSRTGQATDALLHLLSDTVGVADWPSPIRPVG